MEKLSIRQFQILKMIKESTDYITSKVLATYLDVSERTIKTEIANINNIIEPVGCKIVSKSSRGYCLSFDEHYDDNKLIELYPKKYNSSIPDNYYERVIYIIKKLLVVDYHIKIEDFADELFVSRSAVTSLMKDVRSRLAKYRLKVVSRPNYGILIEGSEIDKRLAIAEYFFHDTVEADSYNIMTNKMISSEENKLEYQNILTMIKEVCEDYNIDMSDYSYHNLAVHIHIAMRRCIFYNYVKVSDSVVNRVQNSIEFKAALRIVNNLEQQHHFLLPVGESVYIAHHIRSKRIIESNPITLKEDAQLHKCLSLIMIEINNNFAFNLTQDSEWYHYMLLHIPLMIERLKTHMVIRNPLVKNNMRRYLFASKITHSACEVIGQVYNVKVDINEFGYLLLYFNLVVTRFEVNKPLKVALLSGRGRPEAVMIANEIKEHFSSHKYVIQEVEKLENNKYDLVVSTYSVNEQVDCPTIIIDNDNYLEAIREKLTEIRYADLDLNTFIKEEYCTFGLEGETKDEVEHNFYKELFNKELVKEMPDRYNKCLVDELGNGIVHFQDSYRIVRKSMLYVCVLKKTVYWDKEPIRIMILTKTKKEHDKDLYNLCRVVSKWANDKACLNRLIKNGSFEQLKKDISEKL